MASNWCWSSRSFFIIMFFSGIAVALIASLERQAHHPLGGAYRYRSSGWMRESATWDDLNRRFLVSFMEGGVGQVRVPSDYDGEGVLEEITAVKDADVAGNASTGITVDRARNRVMVAVADVIGNRYSALAAYDLSSWERLFLTQLSQAMHTLVLLLINFIPFLFSTISDDEKTLANDVAVDNNGNAYVTDTKANKIWKISVDGILQSTITSPLFVNKRWYNNLIGLNGIVYHPDGYLLVIHTITGNLYKVGNLEGGKAVVKLVGGGSLRFGDGIELVSKTSLVVASAHPSARLVESVDGWETAKVVARYVGPTHRLATSVAVKDGRAFVSYLLGFGYPEKKHMFVEAVF